MRRKQMEAEAPTPETIETTDPLQRMRELFDELKNLKKEIEQIERAKMDEDEREKQLIEKNKREGNIKKSLEKLAREEIIPTLGIESANIREIMDLNSEGTHWIYRLELTSYPGKEKDSHGRQIEELNLLPSIKRDNPFVKEDEVLKIILTEATDDIDQDEENIKEALGL